MKSSSTPVLLYASTLRRSSRKIYRCCTSEGPANFAGCFHACMPTSPLTPFPTIILIFKHYMIIYSSVHWSEFSFLVKLFEDVPSVFLFRVFVKEWHRLVCGCLGISACMWPNILHLASVIWNDIGLSCNLIYYNDVFVIFILSYA